MHHCLLFYHLLGLVAPGTGCSEVKIGEIVHNCRSCFYLAASSDSHYLLLGSWANQGSFAKCWMSLSLKEEIRRDENMGCVQSL